MIFWGAVLGFVAVVVGYNFLPTTDAIETDWQYRLYPLVQSACLFLVSVMALAICPPRHLYPRAALLVITLYHFDILITDYSFARAENGFLTTPLGMFAEVAVFVVVGALGIWRLVVSARQQSAPDFARAFHRNGDR